MLPLNISVFAFDFSGCGHSEGEFISLGYFEKDDLNVVVEYLKQSGKVSTIGLWGRSMGAVTAILHLEKGKNIAGVVLDSPFSNMKVVAKDLIKLQTSLP